MWRLLIVSLGGSNNTLRVRLWRQLKASGAAALRDGAYLLPDDVPPSIFESWRDEINQASGEAYVVDVPSQPSLDSRWQQLFDRSGDFQQWSIELQTFLDSLPPTEPEARRGLRRFRKDLDSLTAIDFFGGDAREQAERTFKNAERHVVRRFSPDEPLPSSGAMAITQLRREDFQHKLWATRARLWVDRVASAWLIQRFIDSEATFLWLTDISKWPSNAIGFDFDGATFTHVGELVTFEVLLKTFGLDGDQGLVRLGAMVHALDVDGESPPEAAGFEAMLRGARTRLSSDDALLTDISNLLDSLHVYFLSEKSQ